MKNSSRLVCDISGKGFRGSVAASTSTMRALISGPRSTRGSLLHRYRTEHEPPAATGGRHAVARARPVTTVGAVVDHVFWSALGRAPSASERQVAEAAIADRARPGKASPDAVADLLWAVLMKPEFQLIY